jgi:hypothetical protein
MNYSPGFKWLLALLVPITLGFKLVTTHDEPRPFVDRLTTFLEMEGFSIVSNETIALNNALVAARNECRILFAPVSDTLSDELIKKMVNQTDRIVFIFHGEAYDKIPNWTTAADRIFSRIITRLGFHSPSPTLRVAASPQCEIGKIPWEKL